VRSLHLYMQIKINHCKLTKPIKNQLNYNLECVGRRVASLIPSLYKVHRSQNPFLDTLGCGKVIRLWKIYRVYKDIKEKES